MLLILVVVCMVMWSWSVIYYIYIYIYKRLWSRLQVRFSVQCVTAAYLLTIFHCYVTALPPSRWFSSGSTHFRFIAGLATVLIFCTATTDVTSHVDEFLSSYFACTSCALSLLVVQIFWHKLRLVSCCLVMSYVFCRCFRSMQLTNIINNYALWTTFIT